MASLSTQENWEVLKRFLPNDWDSKAVTLGALTRRRKIADAKTLLRVLLIHLVDGQSLRATVAYAKEAGLCDINDAALLHRLRSSSEWFRWMNFELMKDLKSSKLPANVAKKYRVRLVDGTIINEPGATGSDWRIHYSFSLTGFACDTFKITGANIGECLQRFPVEENDLVIGDRVYCKRQGVKHVRANGGKVLVRYNSGNLPLLSKRGKRWPVITRLESLGEGETGDWDVWFKDPDDGSLIKGRFCAIKKSKEAAEKSIKKVKRNASRHQNKIKPETLVFAKYVCLFTTLTRFDFNKEDILLLYRGRWQVELAFKRLKSIMGVGCLPKRHEDSCVAWLHGKMFIALLVERIHQEAESFSPWGYPI